MRRSKVVNTSHNRTKIISILKNHQSKKSSNIKTFLDRIQKYDWNPTLISNIEFKLDESKKSKNLLNKNLEIELKKRNVSPTTSTISSNPNIPPHPNSNWISPNKLISKFNFKFNYHRKSNSNPKCPKSGFPTVISFVKILNKITLNQ